MPLHIWYRQGARKPSSCTTFMLNSLGQSCHRQKKKSCVCVCRVASVVSNSFQPCRLWPARLLCQKGGSPGKNTGTYWPILVTILSRALYFLLP